ncbi:MAG TPA: RnfABCDGE type electron transport complex subunit D [Candidatus Nanoarchaeia archaeon]|nr:RnfABCDGE type electron transport complex subunit D [Candidatus Nanoarchaeia archaeon]
MEQNSFSFLSFCKKIYSSPKNLVILILFFWTVVALSSSGFSFVPQILISILCTVAVDLLLMYFRDKKIYFPESAVISGLIISLVISPPLSSWYILLFAGATAMLSKHFILANGKHIFNPANFGLLFAIVLFGSKAAQTWWGASIHFGFLLLGLIIVYRLGRFHQWIPFVATVIVLSAIHHIATKNPQNFAVYAFQVIAGMLFFSFILLIEPLTSPITKKGRTIFGFLVAVIYFIAVNIPALANFAVVGSLAVADLLVLLMNRIK